MSMTAGQELNNKFHSAVNMGYVLVKNNEINIVDSVAKLVFSIDLPGIADNATLSEWRCENNTEENDTEITDDHIAQVVDRQRALNRSNSIPPLNHTQQIRRRPIPQLYLHPASGRYFRARSERQRSQCEKIKILVNKFHEISVTLHNEIIKNLYEINEIISDFDRGTRAKRAWLPFVGNILSTVTGLATQNDLSAVREAVKNLETLVAESSQVFAAGKNKIQSTVRINSQRITNLANIIQSEHTSIVGLYEEMEQFFDIYDREFDIFISNLHKISEFEIALNQLTLFRSSIEKLLQGILPPDLTTHRDLNSALNNLQNHLNNTHLKIIFPHPSYYYLKSQFTVVRNNQTLIVILECPLTSNSNPLFHYRLQKIPLHVQTRFFSMLDETFTEALFNIDENRYYLFSEPQNFKGHDNLWDPKWELKTASFQNVDSCALSILRKDFPSVKALCNYHVHHDYLPPTIYQISEIDYLLSNITKITINCLQNVTEFSPNQTQFVFELACSCSFNTSTYFIPIRTWDCSDDDISLEFKTKFIVNLPLLRQFFEPERLMGFSPESLLPEEIDIQIPDLTLQEQEYNRNMGLEKSARFHLSEIINSTKNDQKVYGGLSHYLFNSLLDINEKLGNTDLDISSRRDQILMITSIISIISFIIIIILAYKLRQLMVILTFIRGTRAQSLFPRVLRYGSSTTQSMVTERAETNYKNIID